MVAAARTEVGVTVPTAFFIASALVPWFVTDDNNFIKRWNRCLKGRDLSVTEKVYMEKLYDCASER